MAYRKYHHRSDWKGLIMKNRGLSISTKKALNEIIGEPAGREIADLIQEMETEIESLRRIGSQRHSAPLSPSNPVFSRTDQITQ